MVTWTIYEYVIVTLFKLYAIGSIKNAVKFKGLFSEMNANVYGHSSFRSVAHAKANLENGDARGEFVTGDSALKR